jgi:hypothetical protein
MPLDVRRKKIKAKGYHEGSSHLMFVECEGSRGKETSQIFNSSLKVSLLVGSYENFKILLLCLSLSA